MGLDPVRNFAIAQVSTGYDASATLTVLASGKGALFPAALTDGAFNVVWWNITDYPNPADDPNKEIVRVTDNHTTDTFDVIVRAQEGTSASAKNTAGKTYAVMMAPTRSQMEKIAAKVDIQTFTSNGTWTKPTDAKLVEVFVVGGGGGGAAGSRGALATTRNGGGGGGGASAKMARYLASDLGSTETITVGAGGAGGAAVTTDNTTGTDGGNGSESKFGNWLAGYGGGKGSSLNHGVGGGLYSNTDGQSTNETAIYNADGNTNMYDGFGSLMPASDSGGGAELTGANGGKGQGNQAGSSLFSAPGGGGGGYITSGNAAQDGGEGGVGGVFAGATTPVNYDFIGGGGAGGVASGGAGTAGGSYATTKKSQRFCGGGGGGGAAHNSGVGGNGGAGGNYGAGGGGGGASTNGNDSGAGGAGAPGVVIVITHF